MDKIDQVMIIMQRSYLRWWTLRIVTIILLFMGLVSACTPTATSAPTEAPVPAQTETPAPPTQPTESAICPFKPESVNEYDVWYQPDVKCNKGIAVAIPREKVIVTKVDELPWGNPKGIGDFLLNRHVINFEVFNGDTLVKSFSAPVRLYLAYTKEDLGFAKDDYNTLAFAYLDDEQKWVKFDKNKNGYLLLQSQDGGNSFQFWNSSSFEDLPKEGEDYYNLFDEIVSVSELKFVYSMLSTFDSESFLGFAYVRINSWSDRHIGGGG